MTREEKLALAGDYVLGLLSDEERTAFEATASADPELGAIVVDLAERLNALDATAAPSAYDPQMWSRIEQRLGTLDETARDTIITLPRRRARRLPWPGALPMAASVVAALAVGYWAGTLSGNDEEPAVIAILLNEADASPSMIIEAFADDSVRLVPLDAFAAPQGQVLQVWTLPDPETGPVSLGTLDETRDLRLAGPNLPLPHAGQLYEITLEPAPGSPTGRPTGPILVKGFAKPPV